MEYVNKHKDKINSILHDFLIKKLKEDGKYSPFIKELIENIIEFNMRGGKRIRPLLTIAAYKCFQNDEKINLPSISIELMQAYLLIHDDIMDNADLRRGKNSMHKIYEKFKDKEFGTSIAMLAGNLCSAYTYDAVLESGFDDKLKNEAIKILGWVNERENYGQALDIALDFKTATEKDIFNIYELKTATYTAQGPIYLGSILANASKKDIGLLQKYAYNIGVAFQIQDDIIGTFGNEKETGKPNDSDIKEGKKTLLIQKTLEFCNAEEKKFLFENYGSKNLTTEKISKIRKIMQDSGAVDYCRKKLNDMIDEGKKAIENEKFKEEGKMFLLDLADYVKKLVD
jgi:geranylgeranyl diphosphate synthase type I